MRTFFFISLMALPVLALANGGAGMMGGYSMMGGSWGWGYYLVHALYAVVILVDLILLGIWLYQKVSKK